MARRTRSSRVWICLERTSAALVAVLFALAISFHGFGERIDLAPTLPGSVYALTASASATQDSATDAVSGHIHSEHHQVAPCVATGINVVRRATHVVYALLDAHAATYESAPPHGPPRA